MAVKNFFGKKKPWSVLKDRLLEHYLEPYIAKLLFTNRQTYIFDCFAGKGKFDDGSEGSPLIISRQVLKAQKSPAYRNKSIKAVFVEKKYGEALDENIKPFREEYPQNFFVESDEYKNVVETIAGFGHNQVNLFLYVDPYGIKNLDFGHFQKLKARRFASLELLMNFNSFGFLREGCRLLKLDQSRFAEGDEEEQDYEEDENSVDHMNEIANGVYWQTITRDFIDRKIDMKTAEESFAKEYVRNLGDIFDLVVDIPVATKSKNIPKYRMVFGTNHPDGVLLMVQEMHKVWEQIRQTELNGQTILFECIAPDSTINPSTLDLNGLIFRLLQQNDEMEVKQLYVELVKTLGACFSLNNYEEQLKAMEGKELVRRFEPSKTKTGREPRAWGWDNKKHKIFVRRI